MRKIELFLFLVAIAFFMAHLGMAQDQTIRINIELPAGVGLSSKSSSMSSTESDGAPDGYMVRDFSMIAEDGSFIPLVWINMQTYENSQFLLDFKNHDESIEPSLGYFLNDNTNNLQSAQALGKFPALLNFNEKGLLIRNIVPQRITLNAWLGFYGSNQLDTLLLEYF